MGPRFILLVIVALGACRSQSREPDGFIADYADYVLSSDRLGASVASKQSIAPVALFAAAGLLQIDDADERLQEDLVDPDAREAGLQPADWGLTAMCITVFALPFISPAKDVDVEPWTVAVTNAEAVAWTILLNYGVKALDIRDRPNGNPGGFWSGHSAGAFTTARLLDREYGVAVGIPAYVVASWIGYDRIRTNLHYPADVLVGAGMGILIANLVYDKDLGDKGYFRRHYRIEAAPVVAENALGLQISVHW